MAPHPVTSSASDHILPALLSAVALILLLCGLCALCKRRRKRRMRNVRPNGVAIVDVIFECCDITAWYRADQIRSVPYLVNLLSNGHQMYVQCMNTGTCRGVAPELEQAPPSKDCSPPFKMTLLRQTQLRSLSKSDTRLHEIKRPRLDDSQLRPVSMDPLYHSPSWQLPAATPEEETTYSNLNYTPTPLKCSLYECVGSRTEMENTSREPQEDEVTAEYAVVCKIKKGMNTGVQESGKEKIAQKVAEEPILPHRPDDLDV